MLARLLIIWAKNFLGGWDVGENAGNANNFFSWTWSRIKNKTSCVLNQPSLEGERVQNWGGGLFCNFGSLQTKCCLEICFLLLFVSYSNPPPLEYLIKISIMSLSSQQAFFSYRLLTSEVMFMTLPPNLFKELSLMYVSCPNFFFYNTSLV